MDQSPERANQPAEDWWHSPRIMVHHGMHNLENSDSVVGGKESAKILCGWKNTLFDKY